MATTKLSTTKSASRLINYAEKKAVVKSGHNVNVDYAKSQMRQTRSLFGKDDGIQAHHVIQSFAPGETTVEKANEVGLELAEKLAEHHEIAVYTHADTDHIHNHIVINSVNFDTGNKYQAHGIEAIEHTRSLSDDICQKHGLSIITEKTAKVRHTMAEQELLKKDKVSWKEEIRQAINLTKNEVNSFDELVEKLEQDFDIKTHLRGKKTITFEHLSNKRARGNNLGRDYERSVLEREFTRKVEAKREWSAISDTKDERDRRTKRAAIVSYERNQQISRENDRNKQNNKRKSRAAVKRKNNELER